MNLLWRHFDATKRSPPVSIPLTAVHFDVTLTANNFTSEAFKDSISPLFISKETRQCIKGSITLYLTLWLRSRRFCKNRLTIVSHSRGIQEKLAGSFDLHELFRFNY